MPHDDVKDLAQNSLAPLANCPRCRIAKRPVCTCRKGGSGGEAEFAELSDSESLLEETCETTRTPAISLAVLTSTGHIKAAAAGITSTSERLPVNHDAVFEAASLSKPVFAFIVLRWIAKGIFSRPGESPEQGLDRPLHEICDFGPPHLREHPNYKKLTARLILSHQSGLPNWFYEGQPETYINKPGERFGYSGLGYTFLCEVLEHQTGQTLEDLAQDVFKSLGMHSSSFLPYHHGPLKSKLRAVGHNTYGAPDNIEHFRRGLGSASGANCAGSLMTTASDYARFMQACLEDGFVKHCLFSPQIALAKNDHNPIDSLYHIPQDMLNTLHWGLGFGLQITEAGIIAYQWGGADTSRALAVINLTQGTAVVCLTNSANGPIAFQSLAEPVVGSLTPILTCLHKRAGLPTQPHLASQASYDLICKRLCITHPMPSANQEKAVDVKLLPKTVSTKPLKEDPTPQPRLTFNSPSMRSKL